MSGCTSSPILMGKPYTLGKIYHSRTQTVAVREGTSTPPHQAESSKDTTISMDNFKRDVLRHTLLQTAFDIGWFPERLGEAEQKLLSTAGYGACEARVSGIEHEDERYAQACTSLKRLARRWLLSLDARVILFRSQHKYGRPDRVRTHKGVFYEARGESSVPLMTEVELTRSGESIIGGMLVVTEPSFEVSWNWAADYQRAVLLVAEAPLKDAPDRALLERLMGTLEGEQSVWLDYPRLVAACSDAGWSVLRRGGDAGETFVNLTLFSGPEMLQEFEELAVGARSEGA